MRAFRPPVMISEDPIASDDEEVTSSNGPLKIEVRKPTSQDLSEFAQRQNLSHSEQEDQDEPMQDSVQIQDISDKELEALYKRLPPIESTGNEEQDFAMREKTVSAPKTGEIISVPFPPPSSYALPAELEKEKLEMEQSNLKVVRFMPEGKIPTAPQVSVTFNQPMIALSTIEQQQEAANYPLEIVPQVPGRYRWLGVSTLVFEPTYRFPMSTKFEVRIPKAKAQSLLGKTLQSDHTFSFETALVSAIDYAPSSHVVMDPSMIFFYVEFNQDVNIDQIVKLSHVQQSGTNKKISVCALEPNSVEQVLNAFDMKKKFASLYYNFVRKLKVSDSKRQFWFGLASNEVLPLASSFEFCIGPNIPSAEGPLTNPTPFKLQFKTYDPLTVTDYTKSRILPLSSWYISFSNQLDLDAFDPMESIKVTPTLPDLKVIASGNSLTIHGKSKGRVSYQVALQKHIIKDIYGQSLQEDKTITFAVGPAAQALKAFVTGLHTLDPLITEPPKFRFVTCNLEKVRVVVSRVQVSDFKNDMFYNYQYDKKSKIKLVGKQVFDSAVDTKGEYDEPHENVLDLTPWLEHPNERLGHLFIQLEPAEGCWNGEGYSMPYHTAWIQCTRLALDAMYIPGQNIDLWVTSLVNGSVVEKATVKVGSQTAVTDSEGFATLKAASMNTPQHASASLRNDWCLLPSLYTYGYDKQSYVCNMFSDRNMYKPKEKVSFKGYIRKYDYSQGVSYRLTLPPTTTLTYEVHDPRYSKFFSGSTTLTAAGSFSLEFDLPDNINLGNCSINVAGFGTTFHSNFQVQEFRTPEFSCKTSIPALNYLVNQFAIATVNATYYSGGGLANSDATWTVNQQQSTYTPPKWSGYNFGKDIPYYFYLKSSNGQNGSSITFNKSQTDSNGEAKVAIHFEDNMNAERYPVSITTNVSVMDINRQTISSSSGFLVHPSSLYVGLKKKKYFVKAGEPFVYDAVVTNLDGKAIPNIKVKTTVYQIISKQRGYEWIREEKVYLKKEYESKDAEFEMEFTLENGGYYTVLAEVEDENGLKNQTKSSLIVQGGSNDSFSQKGSFLQGDNLTLILDKDNYEVGEEAKLLIQAPYDVPAEGVLLATATKVCIRKHFSLKEHNFTLLTIPITEDCIPNLNVSVEVVGQKTRQDGSGRLITNPEVPKMPAFAVGNCTINVPAKIYDLKVECNPLDQYATPGQETQVQVKVHDYKGNALEGAETTLIVVDEAILSLSNYSIANPLSYFYVGNSAHLNMLQTRSNVFILDWNSIQMESPPQPLLKMSATGKHGRGGGGMMMMRKRSSSASTQESEEGGDYGAAPMMMMMSAAPAMESSSLNEMCEDMAFGGAEEPKPQIQVRTNFCPLATFSPTNTTNSNGEATIRFTLPDSLTRYRVFAIATWKAQHFGKEESFIVANLPLMIRPSLPRFLNFGDKAEGSVVLQNQTGRAMTVNIAARLLNLQFQDENKKGFKVVLPSQGRTELRFLLQTSKVGTAKVQFGAEVLNSNFADAVVKEVPVWTPATSEAFATYGEIDGDTSVLQSITKPKNVYPQFGGLQVSTSSTALQSLTDAFVYLYTYQFSCLEQTASRILSIIAVQDILQAFNAKDFPTKKELQQNIQEGLQKIYNGQKSDGSFGFWNSGSETYPYLTVHVVHALVRAQLQQDYNVKAEVMEKSKNYLTNIKNYIPSYYPESCKISIRAYALYVLSMMGTSNAATLVELATTLYKEILARKDKDMEALAWVLQTIYANNGNKKDGTVTEILRFLMNNSNETAETAHFITSYGDNQSAKAIMLHSDRRTDGIILEALIATDKTNPLIVKVVKGLVAHKKKGRWNNTQENIFILLALKKYFQTFENVTPDFIARIWIGEDYVGEHQFKGRTTDTKNSKIPMNTLVETEADSSNLVIQKQGPGRLYYRLGLDYAPLDLKLKDLDYGFIVQKTYEAIENTDDVQFDKEKGQWNIKLGKLVRVRVTLTNTSRRYHVALVDYLPAGLEALNPELATTGPIPKDPNESSSSRGWFWWNRTWYEHENMRDERVEAFTSLLWEGTHNYSYVARATNAGQFVVPPTKAEEMYSPEIFGRSHSEFVVIQ